MRASEENPHYRDCDAEGFSVGGFGSGSIADSVGPTVRERNAWISYKLRCHSARGSSALAAGVAPEV